MPTITTLDATWDTGVTMDAAELRRADSAMFLGDGSNNGVRGGVVYHGPTSLGVTVNGSDQVTVQPGAFVIPAATGLGVYRGALQAATAATAIAARNATNPRIDLIVIQATGTNATIKTIEGTPGASPSAPALPAQHIEVGRITVPATGGGSVSVDSSWRVYVTAIGGVIYAPTLARFPASGNITGQRAVALDTALAYFWNGSAWLGEGIWQAYTPTVVGGFTAGTTGAAITGRYTMIGKTVHFKAMVVLGTGFTIGNGFGVSLPFTMSSASPAVGIGVARFGASGNNVWAGGFSMSTTAITGFVITSGGAAGAFTSTSPFTWKATDTLEFAGTYEAA